ncbi:immunoglobulin superfamily member 1-like [Rhinophrynus dorsalis]
MTQLRQTLEDVFEKSYERGRELHVLELNAAPVIRLEPEQTVYIEGESLILRCVAESPSSVTGYHFYKDGAETSVMKNNARNILTLSSLKKTDSGMYFCTYQTMNLDKSTESNQIQLNVIETPEAPTLLLEPEFPIYITGQMVTLRCQLQSRTGVTGIQLYQNGLLATEANDFGVLSFKEIKESNAGTYSCMYRITISGREIHSPNSEAKILLVTHTPEAPTLLLEPEFPIYITGQMVTLRCQLQSHTGVTGIQLYQNGLMATEADDFGVLSFKEIKERNAGNYSCMYWITISGREIHSPNSEAKILSVTQPPPVPQLRVFPNNPQTKGKEAQLTCRTSLPLSNINGYRFYHDGKLLTEGSGQTNNVFIISNYTDLSEGCYFCQTFGIQLGREIPSAESSQQFLTAKETDGRGCQGNDFQSNPDLSFQAIKLYGSVLVGKLIVLLSLLLIFGINIMLLRTRRQNTETARSQ